MKFLKRTVTIVVTMAFIVPPVVSALGFGTIDGAGTTYKSVSQTAGMTQQSFGQILVNIMYWLMMLLGIGAIISFVIAGILYLVAGGDEAKTDSAKKMMAYALVGVAVALVGYIAVQTIANLTGSYAADSINY